MEVILGKPQSKKSIILQEKALQAARANPFAPVWYFVPEQYTLQTQRELIKLNQDKGLLNLEVLSFNRLVYRLQNQLPIAGKIPLRASGKHALIYRILSDRPEDFPILAKKRTSLAFIQKLGAILTEAYQYQIRPEKLRQISSRLGGELVRDKTKDLAELLARYHQAMQADYFMAESALQEVSELLKQIDLSQTEVFVDGFYGFVPMQIEILSTFIRRARDTHIAFPYGADDDQSLGLEDLRYPSDLYYDVKNSISKLRAGYLATREEITLVKERLPEVSAEIFQLEKGLFQSPSQVSPEPADHIHLAEAASVEEELRYIAEKILYYIYKEGYRFRDIGILAGNLEDYSDQVARVFDQYKIKYFLDHKPKIKNHPLLLFIESGLKACKSNFAYEEWMQHLKNVYIHPDLGDRERCRALEDEISRLDIYALEQGLRGKKAYCHLEGLSPDLRQIFASIFTLDRDLKKPGSFGQKLQALNRYLDQVHLFAKLDLQISNLEAQAEWLEAKKYSQVGQKLKEYFREIQDFMDMALVRAKEGGEETRGPADHQVLSLQDFISILLSGMEELEYGAAPPVPDQVVVGSLEHSRLAKCKILFAMGLSDGKVPSVQADSGFFSDWERQAIQSLADPDVKLADDRKTSIFKAQLTIFMGLMTATQDLYFSYARMGQGAQHNRPANLFYQIHRMFPHNQVKNLNQWWQDHEEVTYPKPTLTSFLNQVHRGGKNPKFFQVYQALKQADTKAAISSLTRPGFELGEKIGPDLAARLYGQQRRMSISRLERFSACPFSHFVGYGLGAREIVPYQAGRVDMGVFLHKVMEAVFKLCHQQKKQIYDLSPEDYDQVLARAVEAGLANDKRKIFEGNARNRFLISQLTQVADRVIKTSQKQMARGKMVPYQEEVYFRKENMASLHFYTRDGQEFYLEGVIDRLDTGQEGNVVYFSILDYKTSEHKLDYTEIFYGLQLQLLLYLKAGREYLGQGQEGMDIRPVSAAYFHMKNPVFNQDELGPKPVPGEEDFLKSMRLRGVFVREALTKLDEGIEEQKQSLVMNVRLKNDGSPYSNAMVLPAEELTRLEDFAKAKAEDLASQIWQGDTGISPYYYNKEVACTYCPYAGICKVDLKATPYRYLQTKEKEDLVDFDRPEEDR